MTTTPSRRHAATSSYQGAPPPGVRSQVSRQSPFLRQPAAKPLPAWPVVALIGGIGIWWAAGLTLFIGTFFSAVMVVLMLLRGASFMKGLGPWLCLTLWVAAASVTLLDSGPSGGDGGVLAYGMRLMDVVNAAVIGVYVASARGSLPRCRLLATLSAMWLTMVVLGFCSQVAPEFRLKTPLSVIMPGSLMGNDLVRDLVTPPLAEVQHPWGAEEAFNRTAAPFPYANSWGQAYALLTPVVISWVCMLRTRVWKLTWCVLLCLSLYPALATSNRAMLVALAASMLVAVVLMMGVGWLGTGLLIAAAGLIAAVGLYLAGVGERLSERTSTSSSTQDRLELYRRTLERVEQRPLLGHGSPQLDPVLGISFGTQGMIWLLLFCFGIPALVFYFWFLGGVLCRGLRLPDVAGAWIYSGVVALVVVSPFYALSALTMQAAMVVSVTVVVQVRPKGKEAKVLALNPGWVRP